MNYRFVGRKKTRIPHSWHQSTYDKQGVLCDTTPAPGNTYTRETWPPRGRGRGESLTSPRRITAKFRALEVARLRIAGNTWQHIANQLGYSDPSGPYRAYWRLWDRVNWDEARTRELGNELWRELTGDPYADYREDLCKLLELLEEDETQ